jgi:biopolymer transport protein TolR
MAAIATRGGSRRRRSMNEINMVPFIDVMLVLLIIFMVSAPLITTGVVDLPSVGKAQQRTSSVIEVVVAADGALRVRKDQQAPQRLTLERLPAEVARLQDGLTQMPVVISADRSVRYESVVRVMDVLQKAGVQRVGLSVKQG